MGGIWYNDKRITTKTAVHILWGCRNNRREHIIMGFNESFEAAKSFAVNAAQTAVQKAKVLAAIAKTNVSIYAEEDKIKKAEAQLGKLYYRDYAVGEEMDSAEYLPWCQKIDESKKLIEDLKDYIDSLKQDEAVAEEEFVDVDAPAEAAEVPTEEAPEAPAEAPKTEEAPAEAPKAGVEIQIDTTNNEE